MRLTLARLLVTPRSKNPLVDLARCGKQTMKKEDWKGL